jgi:virginiamycin B lyase
MLTAAAFKLLSCVSISKHSSKFILFLSRVFDHKNIKFKKPREIFLLQTELLKALIRGCYIVTQSRPPTKAHSQTIWKPGVVVKSVAKIFNFLESEPVVADPSDDLSRRLTERRAFLGNAGRFVTGGVSTAIVLKALSPHATWARQDQATGVAIKEWKVPFEPGRPRDPFVAPDGAVWFVGQQNHYLARFDPVTEKFTQRKLGDGAGPHNLIVGADGIVWYAGNKRGYIGRYDPHTDDIQKIKMPNADADDPHTLIFDRDGHNIWFTVQWGNFVGRLNIKTRDVDLIRVPTDDARPYGIIMAPDGAPWIALLGTNKLASVDPVSLKLTEHDLPEPETGPRRLVATRDGHIYYVDYSLGRIGHLNPVTGNVREWPSPSGEGSGPYAMAIDDRDRVWYVETGVSPNKLIGFSLKSGTFMSETAIPSGGGSVRHMIYDQKTDSLWFGADRGTIGQARLGSM